MTPDRIEAELQSRPTWDQLRAVLDLVLPRLPAGLVRDWTELDRLAAEARSHGTPDAAIATPASATYRPRCAVCGAEVGGTTEPHSCPTSGGTIAKTQAIMSFDPDHPVFAIQRPAPAPVSYEAEPITNPFLDTLREAVADFGIELASGQWNRTKAAAVRLATAAEQLIECIEPHGTGAAEARCHGGASVCLRPVNHDAPCYGIPASEDCHDWNDSDLPMCVRCGVVRVIRKPAPSSAPSLPTLAGAVEALTVAMNDRWGHETPEWMTAIICAANDTRRAFDRERPDLRLAEAVGLLPKRISDGSGFGFAFVTDATVREKFGPITAANIIEFAKAGHAFLANHHPDQEPSK